MKTFALLAALLALGVAAQARAATTPACGGDNDTAALQAAIEGGGEIDLPAATCAVSGSLKISTSNTHLLGQGPGTTVLRFIGGGTGDGFRLGTFPSASACVGNAPPAGCGQTYNLSIENMSVEAPNRSGGYLFDIDGASQVVLKDIQYAGWDLLATQFVNNALLDRVVGYTDDTNPAGFAVSLWNQITSGTAAGWYRSDVVTFLDSAVNAQDNGAGCVNWDGMVQTVRIARLNLIGCATGLAISNSQRSTSFFPAFLFADDLEIDGAIADGIAINAGRDLHIANAHVNASGASQLGEYPLVVGPDLGGSYTSGIFLTGSTFADAPGQAGYVNAQNVTISGSDFSDTGHAAAGALPALEIAGGQGYAITGSWLGQRWGDPAAPSAGLQLDGGVGNVSLAGNACAPAGSC